MIGKPIDEEIDEMDIFMHDIIIIGAGGAGLQAAIKSAQMGMSVGVISKTLLGKAHTVMAEGGMAAALADTDNRDSWEIHFRDTMRGGKLHNNWRMVQLHTQLAPKYVRELEQLGAVFDRTKDGKISQRHFGGHTYQRLAHVGDRTGLELIRTLQEKIIHEKNVKIYDECTITKLFVEDNRVIGAFGYSRQEGSLRLFQAKAIILATGGLGKCYRVTSNSWECTGDGLALAYNAGAELSDMEFIQFHPTGMIFPPSVAGILVTEGVRGEGGILLNSEKKRFMFNYIPDFFRDEYADTEEEAIRWLNGDENARRPPELLTRDVVARAILSEVKAGRGTPHGGAYLDIASQRSADYIKKKLPAMYHQFKTLAKLDITKEPMEIFPTCHYIMGGVKVDADTQTTSIPGLYAAGEASTGLHGANRLGGNSLSDLLVFGALSGESAAKYAQSTTEFSEIPREKIRTAVEELLEFYKPNKNENPYDVHKELQSIMEEYVAISRTEEGLKKAINMLEDLSEKIKQVGTKGTRKYNPEWHMCIDLQNIYTICRVISHGALARNESRGAHTRVDFPQSNPELINKLFVIKKNSEGKPELSKETIPPIPKELREILDQEGK
ncbi:MAG: fumarate reductase/succinate dehydrogenase flavoprotein subunit [Promethearchaeota archaeon]